MTCAEFRESVMDAARGIGNVAARVHAEQCETCGKALLNQRVLSAGLATLARTETREPSAALLGMLVSQYPARPLHATVRAAAWAVPAMAAAALVWILLSSAPQRVAKPATAPAPQLIAAAKTLSIPPRPTRRKSSHSPVGRAVSPAAIPGDSNPFLMIPYQEPPAPNERAEIVRVNMPVTAAAELGLPVMGADPNARLDADLLLGENGTARAWRLVRVAAH